jgi:transcriptional regulator with XRE-family HTH domain
VFVKPWERNEARRLRRERGLSIKAIAATLAVSSSSVSRWVRDIELTPEQEASLRAANPIFDRQRSGTASSKAAAKARRIAAQAHGRELAAVGHPLHRVGCMLYWAEGGKSRNQVMFANSDADMVHLFLRFLRRCYDVRDDQVKVAVNVHLGNGLGLEAIETWWLSRLGLDRGCLHRSIVNVTSRASQRKRRTLRYGTARITVCSTSIVQSIYGGIQAYAGIDRPEWLD